MIHDKEKDPPKQKDPPRILVGNRIPKDFFITKGIGQSDLTIHAGSYHLALQKAGIERCNIMYYSSILPKIANLVEKTPELLKKIVHGSVMETIMACANTDKNERVTAGIIFSWLYNKETGEKYGGLVCEYNGHDSEEEVRGLLRKNIQELYTNGYDSQFELRDERVIINSFVPKKKYGSALVALCFLNFEVPKLS